ncbi:uncharacterized protein LOC143425998 [Xylocopa sonorina]|uniref:uncharacterized protein LOC143425998 n=1 Tax=Xylocopa sonorina TaxID=1818115 RepID=UPI00403AC86F
MYNLNSNAILSHKNNYNKTSSSKKESLYEQLSLKLKSIKNSIKVNDNNNEIKVHVENEILSNSSLVSLSKKYESCEEYVELCHDYLKSSSNIKSNTSCAAKITNFLSCNVRDDDERNDSSDNKCDIIKTYNNIPGQYANYFRVQEPDEQDIGCTETSTDSLNEKQQIKYIDCSVIWNNAMREKEIITQKNELKVPCKMTFRNRDNVPLGENCFLKAVSNSSHFALRDKDIHWTPTGNINKMQDVSPLILKNLERRKKYFANDIVIGIPQSILEVLTGENVNEVQSSNSLHEVSEISTDNVKCPNTIELHDTKNFLNDSDNGGNFYMGNINTKALAPKLKLLQKILTAKGMSSSTSSLDSDDLSSLEKSILSDYDIDSDNMKFKEDEHESAININRDKSNISYSDSEFECLSSSMEIDAVDLHVQETVKPTTNDIEVYNDKESVSMESDLIKETDIASEIETNEVQMNAQVNELISSYKVTDASSILVFNDIGIESDEEEWDIQVSYADVHNFMKSSFSFNENIQDQLDHKETDSRLEIVEINDSNSIEIENVDAYKVISPDRVINDKVCLNVNKTENLVNPNQISEIHLTGKDSEKSSEISNKYASYLENVVSYKRQGKSKSLAEMLQKVKLLRKNC